MDAAFFSKVRVVVIAFFVFFIYAVIVIRLWAVQVCSGEEIQQKVSRQYVRNIRIPAVRGRIFSSDGVMLAGNTASYEIVFHISEMRRPGKRSRTVNHVLFEADRLAGAIGRTPVLTREKINRHMNYYPGLPITVFKDITAFELAKAYELSPMIRGMDIVTTPVRTYPHGKLAGQLIGYVGREDPRSAEDRLSYFYYLPDTVGRAGLERAYDTWDPARLVSGPPLAAGAENPDIPNERRSLLRGFPGKKLVLVDSRGFVRETIGAEIPAENGKDLVLTLDFRAQKIAESLLEGVTGAIVLLDASNGDILAMASSPSYDPSEFVPRISTADYARLRNDPRKPLFNRAFQGAFSPGSIIKPLVGISMLENGGNAEQTVYCDGYTRVGGHPIRCWIKADGHGEVTLQDALAVSCNDYFIETGLRLGVDRLAQTFRSAGIGSKTGLILSETAGRLPSRSHKRRWTSFDTALISIGQGDVLISPLQAALYTAAIANGGTLWKANLLKEVLNAGGSVLYSERPRARGRLAASPETLEKIRYGMFLSVNSDIGGAKRARNRVISLSGKTGTAEVGPRATRYKNTWFIGFGTHRTRTYAIAVLVEHGASGGKTCAPLAARFFTEWLGEKTEQ